MMLIEASCPSNRARGGDHANGVLGAVELGHEGVPSSSWTSY